MTETRKQKARRLVDEGHVTILRHSSRATEAYVRDDSLTYTTLIHSSGWFFCSCVWGQIHSYASHCCVHALAVKLAVESDIPKDTDLPKEEPCNKS